MNNQLSENFEDPSHPYHLIWKGWYRRATTSYYSHEDPNRDLGDEVRIEDLSTEKKGDHLPAIANPSPPPLSQLPPAGRNDSRGTDFPSLRSASVSKETHPSLSALPANTILSAPFSRLSLSPGKDQHVKQNVQSGVKLEEGVDSMKIQ